jgi:mannose-6-phosphate isomerase-like protein (cupin superfamily)
VVRLCLHADAGKSVNHRDVEIWDAAALQHLQTRENTAYLEFLRVTSMSAGMYVLAAGSIDEQSPHKQDELYCVIDGSARMKAGSDELLVGRGSLVFVAAGVEHRFYDIESELRVLVFFAPAETP